MSCGLALLPQQAPPVDLVHLGPNEINRPTARGGKWHVIGTLPLPGRSIVEEENNRHRVLVGGKKTNYFL